jgi:DNA-binding MarR family transcriptional regulator
MHVQAMHVHQLLRQILFGSGIMARVSVVREDPELVATWRDVSQCHARVCSAMEKALQKEHSLGLSEFEVLEHLATTPAKDGSRMQELADAVCLSQSALSRLIGRLENDGLVHRAMCVNDRRGIYAHLTDEGRARWEAARPTHRAVLAETMPPRPAAA